MVNSDVEGRARCHDTHQAQIVLLEQRLRHNTDMIDVLDDEIRKLKRRFTEAVEVFNRKWA